jgi:hypothetical protein
MCFGAACAMILAGSALGQASVVNGSFEMRDFTGWIATDIAEPFQALDVRRTGKITAFDGFVGPNVVIPSHRGFAATTGFDGAGPGFISIAQDVGAPVAGQFLTFDYRAGWDLVNFAPFGALDRSFDLLIQPFGGGIPLASFNLLTAAGGTTTTGGPNSDTGPLSGSVDLTPFAGTPIRINFVWTVPEFYTGPANGQLDNVRIPSPGSLALLGLGGLITTRRRR